MKSRFSDWVIMSFGALMEDFQNGFASGERDNNGVIQLRMNNVNSTGQMIMNEYIRVPQKYYSSKYDIKEGDILFNHTNSAEMVGKSFVFKGYNEPVTFSNHFSRIRVNKSLVNPNFIVLYLVYLFNQRFFERFCDRWIHQAAFQKEKMLEIQVYFPNLVKQNHIVNTIETKLKSVEKAKQAAEEQLKAADALQEAYLREVFGFDKLPQGWENVRLGTITELITKGTTPTTMGFQFQDKGINFIKIESIMKNGNFLPEKFKHISKDCYNVFNRSQLKENDVLFSIAGALGRIAIVNKNILPANINQAIALVRFYNNTVDYNFVFYVLRSGYVFKQFNKWKRGNAQLNISLENIRDIIIPLPSYKEQKRIAGIIETKLKSVEKAKQLLDQQLSYINALPSAILRQAFNGEL